MQQSVTLVLKQILLSFVFNVKRLLRNINKHSCFIGRCIQQHPLNMPLSVFHTYLSLCRHLDNNNNANYHVLGTLLVPVIINGFFILRFYFKSSLSPYEVAIIFLSVQVMKQRRRKFQTDSSKPSSLILCPAILSFLLKNWIQRRLNFHPIISAYPPYALPEDQLTDLLYFKGFRANPLWQSSLQAQK